MHTTLPNPNTHIMELPAAYQTRRQPCEVWTRVMGYHRPVSAFNIGKQGEFAERQYFVATEPTTQQSAASETESSPRMTASCCA